MMKSVAVSLFALLLVLTVSPAGAQSGYQTVTVNDGGTINGTVRWNGPVPKMPTVSITKDVEICDPQAPKKRDLEPLIV
jgi:hypothetical protein